MEEEMQAGQSVSVSGMVDAVSEQLQGSLRVAEFDPKIETLEQSTELEMVLGCDREEEGDDNGDDEEGEEFEFSFPCGNPDGSPIAAEDAFHNGQIRPIFPLFDQSILSGGADSDEPSSGHHQPLRKLFTEGSPRVSTSTSGEPAAEEDYCPWERRTVEEINSPAAGAVCQKSNSTGSSRLWRFRDLVHRSSSDGKDAFVFLNPAAAAGERVEEKSKAAKGRERREVKAPVAAAAKAKAGMNGKKKAAEPALLYGRSKAAEKRRTYLPYRPGLVGFFTSVNGLSKNVHPF